MPVSGTVVLEMIAPLHAQYLSPWWLAGRGACWRCWPMQTHLSHGASRRPCVPPSPPPPPPPPLR
ncbi:hypothetical protein E2C01_092843 [Portunus trituberculatus]|uniref:Uncharacterized protein n=1 Tax=Portunus trituberculatus TaxID=210409 RepID=A0A5B7JSH9_PORTR|nr:hypothetical protein [Portunus trituberculatus]